MGTFDVHKVTRRQLLGLGASGLALALVGCSTDRQPTPPTPAPASPLPPRGLYVRTIRDRGHLVVGTYTDTFFSTWDPKSKSVVGFDADIAREIANDLFGDPERIEWKEITSATRIPALQEGIVDVVVATMTITKDRLEQIDFSDVYYKAAQMLLVPRTSAVRSMDDAAGVRICAARGSTSVDGILQAQPNAQVVQVVDWSDCLTALQQGQVDAVSTDDAILVGMAAQDTRTQIVGGKLNEQPYGIGIAKERPGFVSYVNGVLIRAKLSGRWAQIHEKWLGSYLPTPEPPTETALEAAV